MTAVGITENVKGDQKKFEIWYSGREEVYVVQVGGVYPPLTDKFPRTENNLELFCSLPGSHRGSEDDLAS